MSAATVKERAKELLMAVVSTSNGHPVGVSYDDILNQLRGMTVKHKNAHYGKPVRMSRQQLIVLGSSLRTEGFKIPHRLRHRRWGRRPCNQQKD
jgi:hypothetical protein